MKQYYEIKTYKQYDRDVRLAVRRGLDIVSYQPRLATTLREGY